MRKKIVWEKWRDPLLSNYEEEEWPGSALDEDGDVIPVHTVERQPIMHTPFGMLSVVDDAMASKSFDFWMMHTNFDITDTVADVIESIAGVESLEVYTRYRLRVGFPRSGLFQPREIMHDIKTSILQLDYDKQDQILEGLEDKVIHKVVTLRDKIDEKCDYWTIWVVPNGNVEVISSDKFDNTYCEKASQLEQAYALVGGRLLTSESE
jgi:hypothetical protein